MQTDNKPQEADGQAPVVDTTPHLDKGWLANRLEACKAAAVKLAGGFKKKQPNFTELFSGLAALCAAGWQEWERDHCSLLTDAAETAGSMMEGWENERKQLATNFATEIKRANGALRDGYRPLIGAQIAEESPEGQPEAEAPAEAQQTLLDKKLRQRKLMCIRYNGHPDGHLPTPKSQKWQKWGDVLILAVVAITLVLEAQLAFIAFKYEAGNQGGIILALVFSIINMALAYLAAPSFMRLLHWLVAWIRFKINFRNTDVLDEANNPVFVYALNAKDFVFALLFGTFFVGSTWKILAWRIGEAQHNRLLKGSMIASIAVALLTVIMMGVKMALTDPLDERVMQEFATLDEECTRLQARADEKERAAEETAEEHEPANDDPYAAVERIYTETVTAARKVVADRLSEIGRQQAEFKRLRREYLDTRKIVLAHGFNNLTIAMLDKIFDKNRDLDRTMFSTAESMVGANKALGAACPPLLGNPELVKFIAEANYHVELNESLVITEFAPVIDAVHEELVAAREEEEQAEAAKSLHTLVAGVTLDDQPEEKE